MRLLAMIFCATSVLLFQNCGKGFQSVQTLNSSLNCSGESCSPEGDSSQSPLAGTQLDIVGPVTESGSESCFISSLEVLHSTNIRMYQAARVPFGSVCQSELRTCSDGALSGSYTHVGCEVEKAKTCDFNGQALEHGATQVAYKASQVPAGQSCQSELRTCMNGVLSGSFTQAQCRHEANQKCNAAGQQISHNESVPFYEKAQVDFGQTCKSENRLCQNGSLSGSYAHFRCQVREPVSCMFGDMTVAHDQSVKAFESAQVAAGSSCQEEMRSCQNGMLSGSYTHKTCQVSTLTSLPPVLTEPLVINGDLTLTGPQFVITSGTIPQNNLSYCGKWDLKFIFPEGKQLLLNPPITVYKTNGAQSVCAGFGVSNYYIVKSELRIKGSLKISNAGLIVEAGGKLIIEDPNIHIGHNGSPGVLIIQPGGSMHVVPPLVLGLDNAPGKGIFVNFGTIHMDMTTPQHAGLFSK